MTLSIVVPDIATSSVLSDENLDSIYISLSTCTKRETLFSGETVDVYVLHSSLSETTPKNIQISYHYDDDRENEVKEELTSDESVKLESMLVSRGVSEVHGKKENLSIWKATAFIETPKLKVGKPVTFVASMIDPSVSSPVNVDQNAPNGTNHDSKLIDLKKEANKEDAKQASAESNGHGTLSVSETLSVQLALMMKLKSTKPGGRNDILLSSLSFEASKDLQALASCKKYQDLQYTISRISVVLPSGRATQLSSLKTPAIFGLHDVTSITYRLVNDSETSKTDQATDTTHPLHITLEFQIKDGDGQPIASSILSQWTPILDFSLMAPPISSSLKLSTNLSHSQIQLQFQMPPRLRSSQSLQKKAYLSTPTFATSPVAPYLNPPGAAGAKSLHSIPQRVKSPNLTPGRAQLTNALSTKANKRNFRLHLLQPPMSSSAVTVNLTTANYTTLSGLRLTFLGKLDVELGKTATLSIQAINLSQRTMHLSLIVKNPLRYNPVYANNNSSSVSSSNMLNGKDPNQPGTLVQNRQQLYQQYHQHKLETCGVIMLTNDVRLGPIEPNAVFESEFELIGISKGVFNLQGLKIFDISSGDGIDFGKLMEVFVI